MANTRVTPGSYPTKHNARENKVIETASSNLANANIASDADIVVTKLLEGTANQVVKTNAAGNALEHGKLTTDNLDASAGIVATQLVETTIRTATVALTNAEILALAASPKELVAAPGADKVIEFVGAIIVFDWTADYTETADNMDIKYSGGNPVSETIESTGFVDAGADAVINSVPVKDVIMAANTALVLDNIGDGEFGGGNAANTWSVRITYRVHTLGLA